MTLIIVVTMTALSLALFSTAIWLSWRSAPHIMAVQKAIKGAIASAVGSKRHPHK